MRASPRGHAATSHSILRRQVRDLLARSSVVIMLDDSALPYLAALLRAKEAKDADLAGSSPRPRQSKELVRKCHANHRPHNDTKNRWSSRVVAGPTLASQQSQTQSMASLIAGGRMRPW